MISLLDVAQVAAGVNLTLLVGLGTVWTRNYREIQSTQTLVMLVFTLVLLAENGLALYYYTWSGLALSLPAIRAMMYLQVLESLAIALLAWVTAR